MLYSIQSYTALPLAVLLTKGCSILKENLEQEPHSLAEYKIQALSFCAGLLEIANKTLKWPKYIS